MCSVLGFFGGFLFVCSVVCFGLGFFFFALFVWGFWWLRLVVFSFKSENFSH